MVVGVDGVGAHRPVEIAFGRIDIGVAERGAEIIDIQAVGGELANVGANAHRRSLTAGDADQPDARKLGDLLRQAGVGEILHLCQRHRRRGQPQRQNRRVGRVHLGVDRRRRQVGGQQIAGCIDGGLHFLLRHIEGNLEAELQRDDRCAGRTDRTHLVEVRHLAELHLQRRGDRRCHDVRAGAGIKGLNLDGRVIDFGQRCDRQEAEGEQAGQHDCDHEQRGRHWPQDEGSRRAHRF